MTSPLPKQTTNRIREASTLLGRPVQVAAAFQTIPFFLQAMGAAGPIVVVLYRRLLRRRAAAAGTVVLPAYFTMALTDDALVVLGTTWNGKVKGPVLYTFPHGDWQATTKPGVISSRLDLTLRSGEKLRTTALILGVNRGNKLVLPAIVAQSSVTAPAAQGPAAPAPAFAAGPLPTGYGAPVAAPAAAPAPVEAAPQHLDAEAFEALLTDLGFEEYADQVFELAVPAARLVPGVGASKERGTSRQGGWPDLAGADAWPLAEDGEPLAFALQVDLGAVSELGVASGLPEDGLLSVFADARGGAPVLVHTEAGTPLKRLRAAGIKDGVVAPSLPAGGSYPAFALEPVLTMSLPATLAEDIGVEDEDVHALLDAVEGTFPLHRVGGHPRELAGSVSAQAAAEAPGRRKADDFRFGLQLDSDPAAGLAHEGEGIAYVLADSRKGGLRTVVQAG